MSVCLPAGRLCINSPGRGPFCCGGTRVNIVPDYATAGGCFRYYDNGTAKVIREHALAIAKGVEEISGCRVEVTGAMVRR